MAVRVWHRPLPAMLPDGEGARLPALIPRWGLHPRAGTGLTEDRLRRSQDPARQDRASGQSPERWQKARSKAMDQFEGNEFQRFLLDQSQGDEVRLARNKAPDQFEGDHFQKAPHAPPGRGKGDELENRRSGRSVGKSPPPCGPTSRGHMSGEIWDRKSLVH